MPSASDAIRALQERASVGVGSRPDRDAERALTVIYRNNFAALVQALAAQEAREMQYNRDEPPPFGHDCRWCDECCAKVVALRRDILAIVRTACEEALG